MRRVASWYHFTFNGAPGSILADKNLRLAIAKGIDRQAIADVTQRGLVDKPAPLNNHIFVAGQKGYQDNSAVVAYDPEKAKAELDALGWKLNGQFREKDGRQLVIRDVLYDAQSTRQFGQIAQNNLAQIGVNLELDAKGGNNFFSQYINTGDFDIAQFSWVGDAFPLCCLTQIYASRCGKQLRQDRFAGDRRKDRAGSRRARPGQGPRTGQRTRPDDLGRRVFPAVDTVGRATPASAAHWRTTGPPGWATWITPRSAS